MGVIEQLVEIKRQEGVKEGLEEERQEIVRSMLANGGFSPAKIAELVGVSVASVQKIKKAVNAKYHLP